MVRQVRGLGKLVRSEDSASLVAKITVPVFLTVDVLPNQSATVDTRMGLVNGHVVGVKAGSDGDTRTVLIALDSALPERADVDLSIDATINIEKLQNVLYVGRPVDGAPNSSISLFKIAKNGLEAQRVTVKFGRSSVNSIEVLGGLKEGDQIILSDMSNWDNVDRIQIK
jgi:multidrug efflux pump subunit AcrA (membrane-fusion protein)